MSSKNSILSNNKIFKLIVKAWKSKTISSKTESEENNLYSPGWVSKILAEKPTASPVHSKIPSETGRRLVAQAISEDILDLLSKQN